MIGCKYISSCLSPSGYGSAARQDIVSLFTAGVNLTCDSISQTVEVSEYGLTGAICDKLKNRDIPYKVILYHLTPDLIPTYQEKDVYMISRLAWETDKLPKAWIKPLNSIQEIWTMTPQMCEMIKKSGVVTPCYSFPQAIDVTKAEEKIKPFSLKTPKDFIFYTIAQWIDRKGFRQLLRAYWKAFEGNNVVSLLIKTYRMNYSESEYQLIKAEIEKWKKELKLEHYPKILLVKKLLTDSQINKLHMLGDCFVNASTGEGWGRGVQEAMLFRKPCISGNNGGITDLMQEYNQVESKLVQATEVSQIPWYTSDMKWKELNEDNLANLMRDVYSNYNKSKLLAKDARKFVIDNFSFQKVGQLMKIRLEEIYAKM